jgi:putative molybdenum carrier protein
VVMAIERVISGGQTGADQGGLDGAILFWGNTDRVGGWCPSGRRSEDGPISAKYPLQETAEWDYPPRTELNVKESDGTVIFAPQPLTPGSKLTLKYCEEQCRPSLIIDIALVSIPEAVECLADWADAYQIKTLNVAGSRETTVPGLQEWVASVIHDTLKELA